MRAELVDQPRPRPAEQHLERVDQQAGQRDRGEDVGRLAEHQGQARLGARVAARPVGERRSRKNTSPAGTRYHCERPILVIQAMKRIDRLIRAAHEADRRLVGEARQRHGSEAGDEPGGHRPRPQRLRRAAAAAADAVRAALATAMREAPVRRQSLDPLGSALSAFIAHRTYRRRAGAIGRPIPGAVAPKPSAD